MQQHSSILRPTTVTTGSVDMTLLRRVLGDDLTNDIDDALADSQAPNDPGTTPDRWLLEVGGRPWADGNQALWTLRHNPPARTKYAGKLARFRDWCDVNGLPPHLATADDLLDYRDYRVTDDEVSKETWNGDVTALSCLYRSMHAHGRIDQLPWTTTKALRLQGGDLPIRSVSGREYLRFRDVGMYGYDLDGNLDPRFTNITPARNSLYCDLLLSTGLRRLEAAHLTVFDLTWPEPGQDSARGTLPPPICKLEKGRPWLLTSEWLNRLDAYHRSEWLDTISSAQKSLKRLHDRDDLLVVTDYDGHRVRINGQWNDVTKLPRWKRRTLAMTPAVAADLNLPVTSGLALIPAAVFPGTRTPSVSPNGWSLVFRDANTRLRTMPGGDDRGPLKHVTPHMLRHTFAINYLAAQIARMADDSDIPNSEDFSALSKYFLNPLQDLRKLLGHSSMDTTYLYLREVTQSDPIHLTTHNSWIEAFLNDGTEPAHA